MLIPIRNYLQLKKVASDQQMAREFRLDASALQPMLDVWLAKGVIARCKDKSACQSRCFKCPSQAPTYYEFIDSLQ